MLAYPGDPPFELAARPPDRRGPVRPVPPGPDHPHRDPRGRPGPLPRRGGDGRPASARDPPRQGPGGRGLVAGPGGASRPRGPRPAGRPAGAAQDPDVGPDAEAGYQEDHVHLSEDAAHYLAQAGIKLLGFDYLSIDRSAPPTSPPTTPCSGRGSSSSRGWTSRRSSRGSTTWPACPSAWAGATRRPPASSCARGPDEGREARDERPAPPGRRGHPPRRRRGGEALPADPRAGQAGGALRRTRTGSSTSPSRTASTRACARSSSPPSTSPRA
jgi:hypothetical protein